MLTFEKIVSGLHTVFPRAQIEVTETELIIKQRSTSTSPWATISRSSIEDCLILMGEFHFHFSDEHMLYNTQHLEVPVKFESNYSFMPLQAILEENSFFETNQQGISFKINKISDYYLISFLCNITEETIRNMDRPILYRMMRFEESPISTLSELCEALRLYSVTMESEKDFQLSSQKKLLNSYLFNVSYNYDFVVSAENFEKKGQPHYERKVKGQLFPYRIYKAQLTKYYDQGVMSRMPLSQYLAYYHVAEYFFHSLIIDDAIKQVQDFITVPSFSFNKKDDVNKLIEKVKQITKNQKNENVWNEDKGLLLCLQKHVPDLSILKDSITKLDSSAIQYYKTKSVPFAEKGQTINFDNDDSDVYLAIRNRIYAVRNAIVHSKDGEMLKYEPFKHDKELIREIPLIRAVAEEIIINSAQLADI